MTNRPSQQQPTPMRNAPIVEESAVANAAPLELLQRAEIDMQIATAKRYPRDLVTVKKKMMSFATMDEDTAAACFYSVPRDGKTIQGPSVRLAEIAFACYGNMRAASRVIDNDGRFLTSQSACHDLESNTLISVEVRRRITGRDGRTYSEDMQVVTGNAANSIAFRNAVFKVRPGAIVRPVYEQARMVAVGDASTLVSRRDKLIARLNGMQVTTPRILARLGKTGIDAIDLMDIEMLIGLGTALRDGDISVDEAFPNAPAVGVTKTAAAAGPRETPPTESGTDTPDQPGEPRQEATTRQQEPTNGTNGGNGETKAGNGEIKTESDRPEPKAKETNPGPGADGPLTVAEFDTDELRQLTANLRTSRAALNRAQLDSWIAQRYQAGQKAKALADASALARTALAQDVSGE